MGYTMTCRQRSADNSQKLVLSLPPYGISSNPLVSVQAPLTTSLSPRPYSMQLDRGLSHMDYKYYKKLIKGLDSDVCILLFVEIT